MHDELGQVLRNLQPVRMQPIDGQHRCESADFVRVGNYHPSATVDLDVRNRRKPFREAKKLFYPGMREAATYAGSQCFRKLQVKITHPGAVATFDDALNSFKKYGCDVNHSREMHIANTPFSVAQQFKIQLECYHSWRRQTP